MVRPTIYANPSQKLSFLKMHFNQGEFENASLWFVWTEITLKTELFENDGIKIVVSFP